MDIREERPQDAGAIRGVNRAAFGGTAEADLVDALRAGCRELVSLVAVDGQRVVGHIAFSPATIAAAPGGGAGSDGGSSVAGWALGPMAVLPELQNRGIGSALVRAGLSRLSGAPFLVVLGHPGFDPRFGFEPAAGRGIRCRWEVPDDVFMIRVSEPDALDGVRGVVAYRPEFGGAEDP